MKSKLSIPILVLLSAAINLPAQNISLGVKFGYGISHVRYLIDQDIEDLPSDNNFRKRDRIS